MMLQNVLMQAAPAGEGAAAGGIITWLPFILILGVMFLFSSRSNKKKEKEAKELRDSLEVGDEITTIGGIVGRVVKLEEETVLLESGSDRTKIRFKRDAIHTNNTAMERQADKKAAQQTAAQEAKEAKKK